ncbi:group III truncated hemoglobin [Gillisia sp. M10.2A]|uniref:Group III truncated hemoglobin n=1 Tax=Gillisia lutea TaxID=2909668 RepID=A0ABS9EEV7_9FLAO|nr:group III truncated hemoglobin [Gillisia lutea]MCF4101405.1 group III truncated hemoglobin [Gillisia lutea]
MKKDIEDAEDIKQLVDSFYKKVQQDELIGYIFNDVAKVNWEKHLPIMYNFWETLLLEKTSFTGNPMLKHRMLSKKTPLAQEHFDRWLKLWYTTIDASFVGSVAEAAKTRSKSIADLMWYKISQQHV